MASAYEAVIGLEVHAQLLTRTKLFCGCETSFGAPPNTHVCPVCLGLPGALPVLNRHAVELAVRAAMALDLTVHERSVFSRKNYFYPDLPKGYQISQYDLPFSTKGHLDVELEGGVTKRVGITRIHMEEDAGKNLHTHGAESVVDLNRAGTPLIEIVGEPDLRSGPEASAYLRALRDVLIFLGVNDGNLEEGSFRCDANVSVRKVGAEKFGTRCEIKNVNSFRFVEKAIAYETSRQIDLIEAGQKITQETRGWNEKDGRTFSLRSKEEAHDYRYFPDPDLPPLVLDAPFLETQRASVTETPRQKRARYVETLGITPYAATVLTGHPEIARFFEATMRAYGGDAKKAANFLSTEVLSGTTTQGLEAKLPVSPAQIAELLALVDTGKISGKQAKEVYAAIAGTDRSPSEIVKERGMEVVSDASALEAICQRVVEANPKQVAGYKSGKTGLLGFFVGAVMKETKGSAEPTMVNELLKKLLDSLPSLNACGSPASNGETRTAVHVRHSRGTRMNTKLASLLFVASAISALPACVIVNDPPRSQTAAPAPAAVAAQPAWQDPPAAPAANEEYKGIAEGRPPQFHSGQVESFWVWHDGNGWHVRTTTHTQNHRFSGRVWGLRGEVGNVRATRTEWNDRFHHEGNQMAFDFHTQGGEDGFDFGIAEGDCAQFYLLVDGQSNPGRVFIGAGEKHPTGAAFRLCQ